MKKQVLGTDSTLEETVIRSEAAATRDVVSKNSPNLFLVSHVEEH